MFKKGSWVTIALILVNSHIEVINQTKISRFYLILSSAEPLSLQYNHDTRYEDGTQFAEEKQKIKQTPKQQKSFYTNSSQQLGGIMNKLP